MEDDDANKWRDDALCKGMDPSIFFPEERNPVHTIAYREEVEEIRKLCFLCPVRQQCLEDSLTSVFSLEHGIWAGTTPAQRRDLLKEIVDNSDDEE